MMDTFNNRPQQGFSLVELLVSIVIGLLLVVGVLQAFVSSKETYTMQSGLAKLQENGRFAMSFLTRDLRQAGYSGCSRNTDIVNTLRDASGALPSYLDFSSSIGGQDNTSGLVLDGRTALTGTDVVEVRFADTGGGCDLEIGKHNVNSATLKCQVNHNFQQGDILAVTDCQTTAIFQQSNVNNNGTISTIVHNTGNGTDIGNCTNFLGSPVSCPSGTKYAFNTGSVLRMNFYRYFVANNDFGEPALYRQRIENNAGVTETTVRELVEGVENMQVLYGEDTDGDGAVDYYVPFDEVADDDDVIGIRVSLLIRSSENSIVRDGQTVAYNDSNTPFDDGRLRKVFTTTIALRNRL
ncbi:PilW family protein [Neptuniibacter sp. QD72_48]|uniref:PilW family protein n=1 Tax=unclassified Neptuniibacter TaxID=2630693 RepID=UPI0039F648BA